MSHDDINAAYAASLSVRGLKSRLCAFYSDERLSFAVQGLGYFKALPGRLKGWAWRSLPALVVGALASSLVSCAL